MCPSVSSVVKHAFIRFARKRCLQVSCLFWMQITPYSRWARLRLEATFRIFRLSGKYLKIIAHWSRPAPEPHRLVARRPIVDKWTAGGRRVTSELHVDVNEWTSRSQRVIFERKAGNEGLLESAALHSRETSVASLHFMLLSLASSTRSPRVDTSRATRSGDDTELM